MLLTAVPSILENMLHFIDMSSLLFLHIFIPFHLVILGNLNSNSIVRHIQSLLFKIIE